MLPGYFAIVGALVASTGELLYLVETVQGKAKPNRVTWILWGAVPMITFFAQRVQGVSAVSWLSFIAGSAALLVVAASFFNRRAYWETVPLDYMCMGLAIVGLLLWALTNTPNLAIVFGIIADLSASFPTVKKTLRHPETESWKAYVVSAAGFLLGVAAVHTWTFANYGFAAYLVIVNGTLGVLAVWGRKLKGERY